MKISAILKANGFPTLQHDILIKSATAPYKSLSNAFPMAPPTIIPTKVKRKVLGFLALTHQTKVTEINNANKARNIYEFLKNWFINPKLIPVFQPILKFKNGGKTSMYKRLFKSR